MAAHKVQLSSDSVEILDSINAVCSYIVVRSQIGEAIIAVDGSADLFALAVALRDRALEVQKNEQDCAAMPSVGCE